MIPVWEILMSELGMIKARKRRNPKTGEAIRIPAHKTP